MNGAPKGAEDGRLMTRAQYPALRPGQVKGTAGRIAGGGANPDKRGRLAWGSVPHGVVGGCRKRNQGR